MQSYKPAIQGCSFSRLLDGRLARKHNQWRANALKDLNGKIKQRLTLVKKVTRSGRPGNPPPLVIAPINPPKRVTSPTKGLPSLCKQALK